MYIQWSCVQICTYSGVVYRYVHTMEFDLSRKKNEIIHFRIMVNGTGGEK